jgi:hypothetical protein
VTLEPTPRKRKYLIRPSASAEGSLDLDRVARRRHGCTREDLIRQAAHARAAERGFRGGDPVADWLDAETEIDAALRRRDHDDS